MSRTVCGICWCPYDDETGECACPPAPLLQQALDQNTELDRKLAECEAVMRQALDSLRGYRREHGHTQPCDAEVALRERLGVKT